MRSVMQVTIGAGASLSSAIDCGDGNVCGVKFPAGWTAAGFQLLGSNDGITYSPMQDQLGVIVGAAATALANIAVSLDPYTTVSFRYVKVQSGTAAVPVVQVSAVTLDVMSKRFT